MQGAPLDPSDPAYRGQAVYTTRTLRAYDAVVVKLSNSLVWRCPARDILAQYDRYVSAAHLDVGPGTGYYLDRCRFPADAPAITLLDANLDVLRYAARRLERYGPATRAGDVLKPIDVEPASFRSVALSYVLHCLPGALDAKAAAFDNVIRRARSRRRRIRDDDPRHRRGAHPARAHAHAGLQPQGDLLEPRR